MIILENFNAYVVIAVNGIFTGFGVAVGTWLAQSHFIESVKKVKRIRFKFERSK